MMDKATKQRLLGGVVLIAGAAIFLPIVLDGSGRQLKVEDIPAPPVVQNVEAISPQLESAVQQAEQAVAAAQPEALSQEEDVAPDAAANAVPEGAGALPATDESAVSAAMLAEKAQQEAEKTRLANEKLAKEKAEAAAKKLAADKLALEKLEKEKKAKAQAAKEAAAKAEEEKAKLLAAKKAESKPAADLPKAWVVQVARLSSKAKADELSSRLRKKNFQAKVQEDNGSWRVLVGPELRKEVAESVKARLVNDPDLGVSGAFLQSYHP